MILNGLDVRSAKLEEIKAIVDKCDTKPKLVIVTIGDDMASNVYVKHKLDLAKSVNMASEHVVFDNSSTQADVLAKIDTLNQDTQVSGIIVQLPIPDQFDKLEILNAVDAKKDIDGFSYQNIAHEFLGDNLGLTACTVAGIFDVFEHYDISVAGKNVVVVGRSDIVGKPLVLKLINHSATVTSCNSKTKNIKTFIDSADIFISAIGSPNFFDQSYFKDAKPGLTVIDVGINVDENNKLCGDIDKTNFDELKINYTPVPKGIGPLTVLNVIKNVLIAYQRNGGSSFTNVK